MRTGGVDLLVTGSGSLSTEILMALTAAGKGPLTVALVGRSPDRLARCVAARAAAFGLRLFIRTFAIDWNEQTSVASTIREAQPKILIHTASLQSPWELKGGDRWSELVEAVGFGITLPLQMALALSCAEMTAQESPDTLFINCCYPDAVNKLLSHRQLTPAAGLGNVSILAAFISAEADSCQNGHLRIVAHHAHVAAAIRGRILPNAPLRAWVGKRPVHENVEKWLVNARVPVNLNSIVGASSVPSLMALLGRRSAWRAHAAGPFGLTGGYPVKFGQGKIELDLPRDTTIADAESWNQHAEIFDGITIQQDGLVRLTAHCSNALQARIGQAGKVFDSWRACDAELVMKAALKVRAALMAKS